MATKTERINVWLTPEQVAWLKTKKNVSETVRSMVTEAMNLDALKESVKGAPKKTASKATSKKAASSTRAAAPSSKRGRK